MGAKKEVTDPVDEVTEAVEDVTIEGDEAEATKDDSKAKKTKKAPKAKGKKAKDADEAEGGEEAPKNAEEVCVPLLLFIPDGLYWPFCPFAFFFWSSPACGFSSILFLRAPCQEARNIPLISF